MSSDPIEKIIEEELEKEEKGEISENPDLDDIVESFLKGKSELLNETLNKLVDESLEEAISLFRESDRSTGLTVGVEKPDSSEEEYENIRDGIRNLFGSPPKTSGLYSMMFYDEGEYIGGIDWNVWVGGTPNTPAWFPGVSKLSDLGSTKEGRSSYASWEDAFWDVFGGNPYEFSIAGGKSPGHSSYIKPYIVKVTAMESGEPSLFVDSEDTVFDEKYFDKAFRAAGKPKGKIRYHADI